MLPRITPILPGISPTDLSLVLAKPDLYLYEQKLEGWRCVANVDGGQVNLYTKQGLSHRGFGEIKKQLTLLGFEQVIFDGEIVCLDSQGNPDFTSLMLRSKTAYYYIFDLLYVNGLDIRSLPLIERKRQLQRALKAAPELLRYVEHCGAERYGELATRVRQQDLEGIIAKRLLCPYDPNARGNWVKILNPNYTQAPGRRKWFFAKK